MEKTVATKDVTKKLTYAEQAAKGSRNVNAKRPTKVAPKSVKDLTAYIRTRTDKQSEKIV